MRPNCFLAVSIEVLGLGRLAYVGLDGEGLATLGFDLLHDLVGGSLDCYGS